MELHPRKWEMAQSNGTKLWQSLSTYEYLSAVCKIAVSRAKFRHFFGKFTSLFMTSHSISSPASTTCFLYPKRMYYFFSKSLYFVVKISSHFCSYVRLKRFGHIIGSKPYLVNHVTPEKKKKKTTSKNRREKNDNPRIYQDFCFTRLTRPNFLNDFRHTENVHCSFSCSSKGFRILQNGQQAKLVPEPSQLQLYYRLFGQSWIMGNFFSCLTKLVFEERILLLTTSTKFLLVFLLTHLIKLPVTQSREQIEYHLFAQKKKWWA